MVEEKERTEQAKQKLHEHRRSRSNLSFSGALPGSSSSTPTHASSTPSSSSSTAPKDSILSTLSIGAIGEERDKSDDNLTVEQLALKRGIHLSSTSAIFMLFVVNGRHDGIRI
jgi:hypothetical protein